MLALNLLILYVKNPQDSALFYEKLFKLKPNLSVPTYVAFTFENGFTLSLWSTQAKDFHSQGSGLKSELSFMVPHEHRVKELRDQWVNEGVPIEQDLARAAFGLTFVALDPDGHRIRVCIPD